MMQHSGGAVGGFLATALTTVQRLNSAVEKRVFSLSEFDALLDRQVYGQPTASGQYVSVNTALQTRGVWECVQVYCKSIASLPCILYRNLPNGGRVPCDDHRLYEKLLYQPNPEMTAHEFWQLVMMHRMTWGNHYSQIVRDDYGVRELWPLDPSKCTWKRDTDSNKLVLVYRKTSTDNELFAFEEIFHVKGMTLDGITGLSPISYARQTIGLALAAEEFGARWFGNGARPGGVLSTAGKLSPEAAKRLKAAWEQAHAGTSNAQRTAVLEEGVTWTALSVPAEDSQFLATRQATKEDLAAMFRVPPHKIGLLEHTNRASIEEQNLEFVSDSLLPELVNLEQAIHRDLVNIGPQKRGVFAEFNVDKLLRGNQAARGQWYALGRQWGWFNADEIREQENLNPIPNGNGQIYLEPLNMVAAGSQKGENLTPSPTGGDPPAPKGEDDPPDDAAGGVKGRSIFRDLVPLLAANGANGRH
jgi:HK97 family phage portal protein